MKSLSKLILERNQQVEFLMIKPGFLHLTNILRQEMQKVGLDIVKWGIKTLTPKQAHKFYEPHKDKDFYEDLCEYMCSGPSLGFKCINSRNIDVSKFKDEIRKKYGIDDMKNVLHSSDSHNRRIIEQNIYFK